MAIAYNIVERRFDLGRTVVECTLDASYPAGGYPLTNASLGMNGNPVAINAEFVAPTGAGQGFLATWDQPANKLKVYEVGAAGAFDEADAADLTTSSKVRLTVFGTPAL